MSDNGNTLIARPGNSEDNFSNFMSNLNKLYYEIPEKHRKAATIKIEKVELVSPLTGDIETATQYVIRW